MALLVDMSWRYCSAESYVTFWRIVAFFYSVYCSGVRYERYRRPTHFLTFVTFSTVA